MIFTELLILIVLIMVNVFCIAAGYEREIKKLKDEKMELYEYKKGVISSHVDS